jgi:protein-tyrosine-phosphatase
MIAVLMVCTANMCRSPMAEALFKKLVSERGEADQWHVESAGVAAVNGNHPTYYSEVVMQKMGMDISQHRSQPVSQELLENFDLVLTMEEGHKILLQDQYPNAAKRIYMLSEMAGNYHDIPDPIGGVLADYEEIALLILQTLSDGFSRIHQLALQHQQGQRNF